MTSEGEFMYHSLCMGVYILFLYDILRILRRVLPHFEWMISLEDIAFWIYCGVKVFLLMYYESNGTLRWFAIGSALFGMVVYWKFFSPYFVQYTSLYLNKMVHFILRPVLRLLRMIKKKLTYRRKIFRMNLKGR